MLKKTRFFVFFYAFFVILRLKLGIFTMVFHTKKCKILIIMFSAEASVIVKIHKNVKKHENSCFFTFFVIFTDNTGFCEIDDLK